jgi:succinyl-CoA synthetase beta subunit
MAYANPKKLLKQLKLSMPVAVTLEDPVSGSPITLAYENLHSLLLVDVNALVLEEQVIASLYAEMARFQRAAEYAASKADGRYRAWRAQIQDEAREEAKASGKKAPTVKALEDAYRGHADYDAKSNEGKRLEAIAGLFDDLKWAFRMKADVMREQSRIIGGYESVERAEAAVAAEQERLADYVSLAEEIGRISQEAGSSQATLDLLNQTKTKRQPRGLPGGE